MAQLQVVKCSELTSEQQQEVVELGGVFFRPALAKLGTYHAESYALLDVDRQVLGAFNVCEMKLKGVPALAHPILHPHCGLVAPSRSQKPVGVTTWKKRVIETIAEWLSHSDYSIVSLAFPVEWVDMQPMIWRRLRCTVRYTYQIALTPDRRYETHFSGSLKSDLRKAQELGVEVGRQAALSELANCWRETAQAQGFDMRDDALSVLMEEVKSGRAALRVARHDEKVIGFALAVHDETSAYYLLGGLSRAHKVRGALGLILVDLMAHYAESGQHVFDFEGSMLPGVERFFRSFGGELRPYYMVSRAKWPLNWLLRLRGRGEF